MAAKATPQNLVFVADNTQCEGFVYGTIVLTSTYASGGDVLDLSGIDAIKSNGVPLCVEVWEQPPAGTVPTGYLFIYCPGTTIANGKLAVMASTTEFAAGAYSAGLLAAIIGFRAWYPMGV